MLYLKWMQLQWSPTTHLHATPAKEYIYKIINSCILTVSPYDHTVAGSIPHWAIHISNLKQNIRYRTASIFYQELLFPLFNSSISPVHVLAFDKVSGYDRTQYFDLISKINKHLSLSVCTYRWWWRFLRNGKNGLP